MNNRIRSLFGLQGLEIINILEYYREIFLYVIPRRKTADCPNCQKRSRYPHEYRLPQIIRHYRLGRRQTFLVLFKRRFKCQFCHKPFMEQVSSINKWQRKTTGLDEEIIELLKESSFLGVKRRLGVNYSTQVKLLKQVMKPFVGHWEQEEQYQGKLALGIDEHSFSGHDMALTITNLTFPRLISILPDDKQTTLNHFLDNIPVNIKDKISSVCIDMKTAYLGSLKTYFPHIPVVVDHFHLIADANKRIDEERRILQNVFDWEIPKKLFLKNKEHLKEYEIKIMNSWFKKLPDLEIFWRVKETLRNIYSLKSKKEAEQKLSTLIKTMWDEKDRGLTQWANNLYYWKNEILNFFDHKITNAYTEGIHTKCKLIKRIGFGFRNREVYIRKVALACLPFTFLAHFWR